MKRHETVVDGLEAAPRKAQHVDLYSISTEVVLQGLDQNPGVGAKIEGTVNEIDPDDAEGLLLQDGVLVPHADMQDNFARLAHRYSLKPDSQPTVRLVGPLMVAGRDRVCEDEEVRSVAANGG